MTSFETNTLVPEINRRFSLGVQLGDKKVETVRAEHALLKSLAAAVLDVPVDALTYEAVAAFVKQATDAKIAKTEPVA